MTKKEEPKKKKRGLKAAAVNQERIEEANKLLAESGIKGPKELALEMNRLLGTKHQYRDAYKWFKYDGLSITARAFLIMKIREKNWVNTCQSDLEEAQAEADHYRNLVRGAKRTNNNLELKVKVLTEALAKAGGDPDSVLETIKPKQKKKA